MKVVDQLPIEASRREIVYSATTLRGLAILAVVAEHITLATMPRSVHDALVGVVSTWSPPEMAYSDSRFAFTAILLYTSCRFAVPLFFILSCFGLALRPIRPGGLWGFYRRKLPKLIIPYLVYFALYAGLNLLVGGEASQQHFTSWFSLLKMLLGFGGGHLWFIHTLILLHVLHPFAWHLYREVLPAKPASVAFLGIIQIGVTAGICSLGSFSTVPLWLHPLGYAIFKSWWYLFAGYLLSDYADRIFAYARHPVGRWTGALVSFAVLGGIAVYWTSYMLDGTAVGGVPGQYAVLYVPGPILAGATVPLILTSTDWMGGRFGSILKSFGLYSLGVYLMHPVVQLAMDWFLRTGFGLMPEDPVHLVLSFGLVPWVTLAVVRLLARSSVGRFLT